MELTPLHNPADGVMRVIGFMSGSGSNLIKIIKHQLHLEETLGQSPYEVVGIFSDNHQSKAHLIGKQFNLPTQSYDRRAYHDFFGRPQDDLELRAEYDAAVVHMLKCFEATVAAFAGYMSVATKSLIDAYLGINVHPADLTIIEGGRPKYTGAHAVRNAIMAGEPVIRASTHIVEPKVDCGRVLMVSKGLEITPEHRGLDSEVAERLAEAYQNVLKEQGDWIIFPRTLEFIATGRIAKDQQGALYFDEKPIPQGIRMD